MLDVEAGHESKQRMRTLLGQGVDVQLLDGRHFFGRQSVLGDDAIRVLHELFANDGVHTYAIQQLVELERAGGWVAVMQAGSRLVAHAPTCARLGSRKSATA